jgi:SOS-response transcriptional repressor LexA
MSEANDIKYERIPVKGQLGAGTSVEFLPCVRWREVKLPRWARASDQFVLSEICGNSLIGAGIQDGDLALIHLTTNIREGDLVAVLTPLGMLVKFLAYKNGHIILKSANANYPPRTYDPAEVTIQGKVIRTERPA